jgi:DNA gyrase inhibitor GyrI
MAIGKWVLAGIGIAALGGAAVSAQYRDRQSEQPAYDVEVAEDDFELRKYAPMIVAQVTHSGDRRRASGQSFRRLAAYIFAQDRPAGGERIAMTAPVIQQRADQNEPIAMTAPVLQEETEAGEWRMRFVMPSRFTMETLPKPPSDITLTQVSARRVAALRFSGFARERDWTAMEESLIDWTQAQGLTPIGGAEYASYDAPGVPGPLRRNEVLIEVAAE